MGLFDSISVEEKISKELGFKCRKCGEYVSEFQTKDLGCGMDNYALLQIDGEIKLVKYLGPKYEYWVEATDEEKKQQKEAWEGTWKEGLDPDEGYFASEAYEKSNQDVEVVYEDGEKILEMYETCCRESVPYSRETRYVFVEVYLKLVKGSVAAIRDEPGDWKRETYLGKEDSEEPEPFV